MQCSVGSQLSARRSSVVCRANAISLNICWGNNKYNKWACSMRRMAQHSSISSRPSSLTKIKMMNTWSLSFCQNRSRSLAICSLSSLSHTIKNSPKSSNHFRKKNIDWCRDYPKQNSNCSIQWMIMSTSRSL